MTVEKGTIVIEGTFQQGYESYFQDYSIEIKKFLQKYDAITTRRQLIEKTLYGQDRPNLIMIIDFPNKGLAEKIFFEQEYLSLIPLRDKVFKTFKMYLAKYGNV